VKLTTYLPTSAEVNETWTYTHLYAFMAWCLMIYAKGEFYLYDLSNGHLFVNRFMPLCEAPIWHFQQKTPLAPEYNDCYLVRSGTRVSVLYKDRSLERHT
jgi:hypothetical protein